MFDSLFAYPNVYAEIDLSPGRNKGKRVVASKRSIPEGRRAKAA